MNKNKILILAVIVVIVLLAASRLVKHPFNFTPITAMAIFAGFYLKKYWGLVIPLAATAVSDYFLGFYDWQVMISVYVGFAIAYFLGWLLSRHKKWYNIFIASAASSLIFFIITNFSVWAFFNWYPHTWAGFISCFTLALPFFRNGFVGDFIYTGLLFGLFEAAIFLVEKRATKFSEA